MEVKASDISFFLLEPNSFIGGLKPIELIETEPEKVVDLLKQFLNPASVF